VVVNLLHQLLLVESFLIEQTGKPLTDPEKEILDYTIAAHKVRDRINRNRNGQRTV
jgi:hypothetical protein